MKKILFLASLNVGLVMVIAGCCEGGDCPCSCRCNNPVKQDKSKQKKEIIKEAYSKVAQNDGFCCASGGCCGGGKILSEDIGYTREELDALADANLGLGCGQPVSFASLKAGDVVVDLGSGAGLDCFLAARKVGGSGQVIGIDMTEEMIQKARKNAQKYGFENVQFRHGDIEKMPVATGSVDVVMSNCVINLAPDKESVFKEAYRVLKPGGRMVVSDVVLLGALTEAQQNDPHLLCVCVSGAIMKDKYIAMIEHAGFKVSVVGEDTEVNKKWFGSDELPISSLKFIATKQ